MLIKTEYRHAFFVSKTMIKTKFHRTFLWELIRIKYTYNKFHLGLRNRCVLISHAQRTSIKSRIINSNNNNNNLATKLKKQAEIIFLLGFTPTTHDDAAPL